MAMYARSCALFRALPGASLARAAPAARSRPVSAAVATRTLSWAPPALGTACPSTRLEPALLTPSWRGMCTEARPLPRAERSDPTARDDMAMNFTWDTLHGMQEESCRKHARRKLFATKQADKSFKWITYAEFGEMVDNMRGALVAAGIQRGDKIAIISKNRVEWAVTTFASYGLGVHSVPMYETQRPAEWEYIIQDAGARIVLVSTEAIRDKVAHLVGTSSVEKLVCFDAPASDETSFAAQLAIGESRPAPALDISPDDTATLIYTSGTTGNPKGVVLSHGNISSNVQAMRRLIGMRMGSESRSLSFLPHAHVFGQTAELHALMSAGGSLGLAESPQTILEDIKVIKPTILFGVPTVFNKIYDAVKRKISSASPGKARLFAAAMNVAVERRRYFDEGRTDVAPWLWMKWQAAQSVAFSGITSLLGGNVRMAVTGGAALDHAVQQWFDDIGIPIIEGYGLTETSPCVASERFGPTEATQGGLRAIPGVNIHICEINESTELGVGEEGEICVSGPNVMQGYHNLPEATAEVLFDIDGRRAFRTGDLGRLSEEGVLSITGRAKEQYKLENGKFVVPGPIEDGVRLASMFIAQAFVYGLNKPHNVMIIVPDFAACAEELGLAGDDAVPANMVDNAAVIGLIATDIDYAAKSMKHYTVPQAFKLITEEFTVDNGLLTPKMSMKRPAITARFKDVLESLY